MTVDTPALSAPPERALPSRRSFELARLVRAAGYVAVFLALTVATATFLVLTGRTPIYPSQNIVVGAAALNGGLVVFLVFVVAFEAGRLIVARRRGRAAARLHIRIVALFSIIAAAPAILVAVVASLTLNQAFDNWFSSGTQAIVDASTRVAQTYQAEEVQSLQLDLVALKAEIERAHPLFVDSPDRFENFIASITSSRRVI